MKRADAILILGRLRPALEARGVIHAALFGSVARGEAEQRSDVDIVIAFAPGKKPDLIDLGGVQSVLEEAFDGLSVDLIVEPLKNPALRNAVEKDRAFAF